LAQVLFVFGIKTPELTADFCSHGHPKRLQQAAMQQGDSNSAGRYPRAALFFGGHRRP
jgi:hypothetical protein